MYYSPHLIRPSRPQRCHDLVCLQHRHKTNCRMECRNIIPKREARKSEARDAHHAQNQHHKYVRRLEVRGWKNHTLIYAGGHKHEEGVRVILATSLQLRLLILFSVYVSFHHHTRMHTRTTKTGYYLSFQTDLKRIYLIHVMIQRCYFVKHKYSDGHETMIKQINIPLFLVCIVMTIMCV